MDNTQLIDKLNRIKALADECLREMATGKGHRVAFAPTQKSTRAAHTIDFSLPMRPFIKKYGLQINGAKRFTLLAARLAKGDLHQEVSLFDIEKNWDSMTGLMGMKFNRAYSQQAKDNDWVETKKKGIYTLRPSWAEAVNHA